MSWFQCCCPEGGSSTPGVSRSGPLTEGCFCCKGGFAPSRAVVCVPDMIAAPLARLPCGAKCGDFGGAYEMVWTRDPQDIYDYCFPAGTSCWYKCDFDPVVCNVGGALGTLTYDRAHLVIGCGDGGVEFQFSIMPQNCHGPGGWIRWTEVLPILQPQDNFDCCWNNVPIAWPGFGTESPCMPVGNAPVTVCGVGCGTCNCGDVPPDDTCCGAGGPPTIGSECTIALTNVLACICKNSVPVNPAAIPLTYIGTGAYTDCRGFNYAAGSMKWTLDVANGSFVLTAECVPFPFPMIWWKFFVICCKPGGVFDWSLEFNGGSAVGDCTPSGLVLSNVVFINTPAGCPGVGANATLSF